MFERYTERARRVLFFARYEVVQRGGTSIEPEHVVLGVLRDRAETIMRFARPGSSVEALRTRVVDAVATDEKVATSVEIPFSAQTKTALEQTLAEADGLKNTSIRPEHLILGVVVKTNGVAARALHDVGVDPDAIRTHLRSGPEPLAEPREVATQMAAFAVPGGTIARQWRGVVKPGKAEAYLTHLRETIFALTQMDGFMSVTIMRRDVDDGTEFQVTTFWRTLDAIKAFAGEDVTRAVVPPAAHALMVRYDDRAVHYDVVH